MDTTVQVGPDRLWAEDSGSSGAEDLGAGGDVPVVVLLHPGVGDARSWDLVWPILSERVRVIRYDTRGFGRSPAPTAKFRQVDDLISVLDHFGLSSAHLVGCSMGGGTAIDLALAHPERVRSLTLLCPGVSGYKWPADPEQRAQEQAAMAAGEDAVVELGLSVWAAAGTTPLIADLMRSAVRAWPAEEEFCQSADPAFDRLQDVRSPAVLMVGDRDWPELIKCDEQIASRMERCDLIKVPGADHFLALREPELVAATVLRQCDGNLAG